jgi:hypothetical protein
LTTPSDSGGRETRSRAARRRGRLLDDLVETPFAMVGIVEAEHEEAFRQGAHQEGFIVAGRSVSSNVALSHGSGLVAKGFPITQNRRNKQTDCNRFQDS